jgi:UDP-N-acetylglucosamine 2-epimerase (non-hydrolysing)
VADGAQVKRLLTVLGTRPELVKLSPVIPRLDRQPGLTQRLLHTGQHYSIEMDAVFFRDLELRLPDVALQVGSGSHASQTAAILCGVERALLEAPADAVVVLGDTNSTLGGALAAAKLGVPVVHLEAGCRSFLPGQPEEINRVLVDHCARHLLAPDEIAAQNLRREGLPEAAIAVVGSTSIDAAVRYARAARGRPIVAEVCAGLGLTGPERLLVCTVHRAENTVPEVLAGILRGLCRLAEHYPIAFPVHPRTRGVIDRLGEAAPRSPRLLLLPPLGYLDMLALLGSARALLTDSGGLQEEAAAVGTPALVLRNETEWSYLVTAGRNALVGNDEAGLYARALSLLSDEHNARMRRAPCDLGLHVDEATGEMSGSAAGRIVEEITRRVGA